MSQPRRMDLEPGRGEFRPTRDHRPTMPEPPPVRLVSVEDVHAPSVSGKAPELDGLYVGVLHFERESAEAALVYRAENFRLRFDVRNPPLQRDDFRPIAIEVPCLADVEKKLIELETEYERQRGLSPAQDQLAFRDPAGNWLSVSEMREFR